MNLRILVALFLAFFCLPAPAAADAGTIPILSHNLLRHTAYIDPKGDDANSGTFKAPLATLDAAARKLGGRGTIIVMPGVYRNARGLDCTNVENIKIVGRTRNKAHPVFLFGTPLTNWTDVSNGVYCAAIDYLTNLSQMDFKYVFEFGTPEGFGPRNGLRVLNRTSHYRSKHSRLALVPAIGELRPGTWFSTPTNIYVKLSDGGPPNGRTVYVSSNRREDSFVHGGTGRESVMVSRIEADFGFEDFDFSGLLSFKAYGCLAVGAFDENFGGFNSLPGTARLIRCESVAANNDGFGYSTRCVATERHCWSHDNADEGTSPHFGARLTIYGGLYDRNNSGGITPFGGASAVAFGARLVSNLFGVYLGGTAPGPDGATTFEGHRITFSGNIFGVYLAPGDVGLAARCWQSSFDDSWLEVTACLCTDQYGRGQDVELDYCNFGSARISYSGGNWKPPVITPAP